MMQLTPNVIRLARWTLLLVAMFIFSTKWNPHVALAAGGPCESYCTPDVNCDDDCLINLDQDSTCGAYGVCAPECSDVCRSDTSCDTPCSGGDGGNCGNYNGGVDNGECYGACGDGMCESGYENCNNCPADCGREGSCNPPSDCVQCTAGDNNTCDSGNICDSAGCCILNETQCSGGGDPCRTSKDCCDPSLMCYGEAFNSPGTCWPIAP